MAIVHLGAKRLQGTKVDRVSDSLGSSADGVNTGITLLTNPTTNNGTATNSASNANRCEVWQLTETIPEGAVITKLKVQYRADESSTNTKLVLYQDNGSGTPTTLLAYTAEFNPNVYDGWYEANIAYDGSGSSASSYTVTSSTAGRMWVGIWANADSSIYASTVSGSMKSMSLTYAGGSTAPTSTFSVTDTYNMKGNCGIVSTLGNPQKLGTGCYSFDQSVSGKVEAGSASDWQFLHNTGAKWTIATWFKRPTAFNGSSISGDITWLCETTDGNDSGIGIKYDNRQTPNHQFQCEIINESNATVAVLQINDFYPDDDNWHHIAVTFDQTIANTNLIAYLDGVQKGTANKSATPSDVDSGDTLRIGGGVDSHARYGNWTLDDMAIYKRVLTATEIGKLYNNNGAGNLTKDAQATTNTSSSGTTITNSSFTVANNSNRILIVCAYRFGSGGDISGITWNSSESFTRATFRDGSTETGRTEIWYLVNPTATTSNIVTTWDASTSRRGAGVYSFYNAKQTSPIGATAYDDEITTVTDGAITPTVSGSMIIDCIGSGSNGAPTDSLTAGWTSLIGGDDRSFSSQYKVDPTISSANTMAWTFASDKGVNWIAVEVKSANSTGNSAQLVSSLTNKSEGKAYYSMDTAGLSSSPTWTEDMTQNLTSYYDTSEDSNNQWQKFNPSTDRIEFSHQQNGTWSAMTRNIINNTAMNTAFNTDKWTCRFKVYFSELYGNDSRWSEATFTLSSYSRTEVSTTNKYKAVTTGDNAIGFHFYNTTGGAQVRSWRCDNGTQGADSSTEYSVSGDNAEGWYYCEIKRNGSDVTGKVWTGGYEGTLRVNKTWDVGTDWASTTGDPMKYFGVWSSEDQHGNSSYAVAGYIDELKIYNGIAQADCPNDFSATASLDGQTNLPVNTIFEQTDDTPTYYWKQADGTWKLDGTTQTGGDDITTDITWTQLVGTSSDTFYVVKDTTNKTIDVKNAGNSGTDGSPSIAYATLSSTLSSSAWIMRYKLKLNNITAESSGGKSFFTNFFLVDNGAVWDTSENGFGFRFIADAGSTQTQFYSMTSGTSSGTSMSYTPATGNTLYVQISYSSGTATANFYTDSGFSTGTGTANVTRSGTFSGLKFPQIALRQDNGGNGVMDIEMSDLKIQNGRSTWV